MLQSYPAELRRAAGMDAPAAARYLEISTRTLNRWELSGKAPRWALDRLYARAYGVPLGTAAGKAWDGWIFRRGRLISPEGLEFTPGDLRAAHFDRGLLEIFKRQFARWCAPPLQQTLF